MSNPTPTVSNLLAYAHRLARIEGANYVGAAAAYNSDRCKRDRQRRRVMRDWASRISHNEALIPGRYGRLTVSADGVDYVPGQYAALEIWDAVHAYLSATN